MGTSWCARLRVWERGCGQTIYCSVQERECGRPPSLGTRKSCRTAKAWGLEAGSMSDYGQIINSRLHLGTIRSKTCSFEFPKNNRNGEAFIVINIGCSVGFSTTVFSHLFRFFPFRHLVVFSGIGEISATFVCNFLGNPSKVYSDFRPHWVSRSKSIGEEKLPLHVERYSFLYHLSIEITCF